MTMRVKWMEMTSEEVAAMAERTPVALLPVGSVEKHGPHLPCGNDAYVAEKVCELAAAIEPAMVLPTVPFNVGSQGMYWPGCIATRPETTLRIYRDVCAEAARNGFDRIVIFIGHGGSQTVAEFYQEELNWQRVQAGDPGYLVFWSFVTEVMREAMAEVLETSGGHACEYETSLSMIACPELVHEDLIPGKAPVNEDQVPGAHYRLDWALRVPECYLGEPARATLEKGERLMQAGAENLAEIVRRVKVFDPEVP